MDATIKAMSQLVDYGIVDVTAAATYYMAETYFNFSRSLVESERPTDLKPVELEAFETALDEEAFPFEEKAIGVHEKNLEMLRAGVFNEWTEKSLGRLAELMPGRYAKREISSGFLVDIDSYTYASPTPPPPPAPSPAPADGGTAPADGGAAPGEPGAAAQPAPTGANEGTVDHATPR
jgi:hypothetical protein